MPMQMARCPVCEHMVIKATMQSYAKHNICVECYAEVKLDNDRTGKRRRVRIKTKKEPMVIKYGTAEQVQKKDGKAVISEKKLSGVEVSNAVQDSKTASKKKKKSSKNVTVTREDYKQE